MNYLQSIAYIESMSPTLQAPCLERVQSFMAEHGNPQDGFKTLHVGGTNGKGSTVAMLDSALRHAGMKTGRFTGPHLLRWNERFHVAGKPIDDDCLAGLATRLRDLSEDFGRRHPEFGCLTWFEFVTVMAFIYFAESKVDIAVLEVGLGGRWDATNVVSAPAAVAITNVDLDHTQILGETISKIAREKAGIIKPGIPVVTAATGKALAEIASAAKSCRSPLYHCSAPGAISFAPTGDMESAQLLTLTPEFDDMMQSFACLSLAGSHQQQNALVALAVLTASGLTGISGVSPGEYKTGLAPVVGHLSEALSRVFWPGRMQYLERLNIVLDGAHNPAGAAALRQALQECFPEKSFSFVLGCLQNKDVPSYMQALIRPGDRLFACEPSCRRAVFSAHKISEIARARDIESIYTGSVAQALCLALEQGKAGELVVVTGSFATVADVMLHLGWQRVEDGLKYTCMNRLPATSPSCS